MLNVWNNVKLIKVWSCSPLAKPDVLTWDNLENLLHCMHVQNQFSAVQFTSAFLLCVHYGPNLLLVFCKKRPLWSKSKTSKCVQKVRWPSALRQMDPQGLDFRSGWPLVRLWVRLTFGQMYTQMRLLVRLTLVDFESGWHLLRCTPKYDAYSQVDIWSELGSGWHFVRCTPRIRLQVRLTFGQMYPPDEASGQVDIWSDFGWFWHLLRCTPQIRLRGRLTFGQIYGQTDICSDVPPQDETEDQVDIWSDGWLAGQLQLAGHLTKCHLCIDVKDGQHQRFDIGSGWHFVRWLVGWPIAACWLTGHLTKCQPDPPQDLTLG